MINAVLLLIMFIVTVVSLLICLVSIVQMAILRRKKFPLEIVTARIKKSAVLFAGLIVLMLGLVMFSQFTAHTPQMLDQNGKALDGSITELKKVVGGRNG